MLLHSVIYIVLEFDFCHLLCYISENERGVI